VLAALLQATGKHQITLCTRRPLSGLTVATPDGVVDVTAVNGIDPERAEPVDWVLVATKTFDAAGAAAWLPALCAQGARVAVVQNGVEHRDRFAAHLSQERIVPVIIDCQVERRADGSVVQRSEAHLFVESGAAGREFAQLFAGSKADIQLTEDFVTAAWRKLSFNSAGVVCALTSSPSGVLGDGELGTLAMGIASECIAVAQAEGAKLEEGTARRVLEGYRAQAPDSVNSLLADRLAGRTMEIDARNGVIVRKGEQHGIPTPLNRMAVALLKNTKRVEP
jgi:2-dehydropantoate 2-reductase